MLKGSLEIIEFEARQAVAGAVPQECPSEFTDLIGRLRLEHRTLTSCAAALLVFGLHLLLVAPVLLANSRAARHSQERYRGDPDMQYVILEGSSGKSALSRPPLVRLPALQSIGFTDALPTPSFIAPPAQATDSAQSDSELGLGAMYGRYLGQIHARIDRAWLRPRTAIGASIFQCQVQVDQDGIGRVLAVTLVECNGGTRWQLSLVHAIEAASPLPPPPNQAVFVHHILLAFRAVAYAPGVSAESYEPPGVLGADYESGAREIPSPDAFRALGNAAREHSAKAIRLQIEGSKVEVQPDPK